MKDFGSDDFGNLFTRLFKGIGCFLGAMIIVSLTATAFLFWLLYTLVMWIISK